MATRDSIILGGGCFWCVEAVYNRFTGIILAESGYAGGEIANPTYEQVCSGTTGHTEVVRIVFEPETIALDAIIDLFWHAHDPTTLNRQGADVGTQYRSAIYYQNEAQHQAILASKARAEAANLYADPFVTEIAPLKTFYPAEAHHQDYYRRNPDQGYCRVVIAPKLQKLTPS